LDPIDEQEFFLEKTGTLDKTQASLPRYGTPRVILEEQRDAIYDTIQTNINTIYEDLQSIASNASQRTTRTTPSRHEYSNAQQRLAWASNVLAMTGHIVHILAPSGISKSGFWI
jgi:hypothetical protein